MLNNSVKLMLTATAAALIGVVAGYFAASPSRAKLAALERDNAILADEASRAIAKVDAMRMELSIRDADQAESPLSPDASTLLRAIADDKRGRVELYPAGGFTVSGIKFGDTEDPRSQARWNAAADQLKIKGFIELVGFRGYVQVYRMTQSGYEAADRESRKIH